MTAIQLTLATELQAYVLQPCYVTAGILIYNASNPKDNYDMSASVFVVQFNGFMSLRS